MPAFEPAALPLAETSPDGLTATEVAERVKAGKSNHVSDRSSRSLWSIFRANVLTLFNGIVVSCFLVLFVLGRWQDALFGFAAIANALIGVVQEFRAKRALDKLALLHAPRARVMRDGAVQEVDTRTVVLDDLLILRAGDQIPADAVVVAGHQLELDESLLTGESDPVNKDVGDGLLSGSIVVGGEGSAVVNRVGADSFANRLTSEAKRFSLVNSELRNSINRILKWITWAIFPIMAIILNAQMQVAGGWAYAIESGAWRQASVSTIASIIAMIPLGLVLITSITFAVAAVKLTRRQVLVQELPAVEGLARVDIVCLDKTGTLTEGDIIFDATHRLDTIEPVGGDRALAWLGADPNANSTARTLAGPYPGPHQLVELTRIGFSSARKWSAVSFADGAPGTWVLGAPEMLLDADSASTLDTTTLEAAGELAASGRRTLVFAHCDAVLTPEQVETETLPLGLRPVALITFRENVRADAAETLDYFREQGVGVRIISGDNPATVAAVAREVGLDVKQGFDARQLPTDPDQLGEVLEKNAVFGRVTPSQKKDMVLALKKQGHVVAMTGDGVNDALAIKDADIGIAMESGSAATKAVSRLVLLDGRFSHLPGVVAEGRRVIANIERVSMLFLTKTTYAVGLSILFGVLIWEFPFLPRQLSLTDGLAIGIPAFFLALMPNARRYEPGFLKRSLSFAIPCGLVVVAALAVISGYAVAIDYQPEEPVRTASTLTLGIIALWVLVILSRPFNIWRALIVVAMYLGLVLAFIVPLTREFFLLTEMPTWLLTLALVTGVCGSVVVELIRFVHKRTVLAVKS